VGIAGHDLSVFKLGLYLFACGEVVKPRGVMVVFITLKVFDEEDRLEVVDGDLLYLLAVDASDGEVKQGPFGEKVGGCALEDISFLVVHHDLIYEHRLSSLIIKKVGHFIELNGLFGDVSPDISQERRSCQGKSAALGLDDYVEKGFSIDALRVFASKPSPLFFAVFGCFVRRLLEGGLRGYGV